MATLTHTILSLATLSVVNFLIYFQPSSLIGFINGPSDQVTAIDKYQFINTFLSSHDPTDCDAYTTAYENASLLRDAGIIASLFTLVLLLLPGFVALSYTKRQKLYFILLLPFLWVTPGLIGQILSAQIPIELSYLEAFGMNGISMVGYCSLQSLVSGGHGITSIAEVVYELKVVSLAAGMLFVVLGIVPVKK